MPQNGCMTVKTLETVVKKALQAAENSCVFGFQGGEPTLAGLEFYRLCISLVNQYKKENTKVFYKLQTNGLVMDEKWVSFLKENNFQVEISIDGGRFFEDFAGQDKTEKQKFCRVMENAGKLLEAEVDVGFTCVITDRAAMDIQKIYRFLKEKGFLVQRYQPCMEPFGEARGSRQWSLKTSDYGQVLCELFDLWYDDYVKCLYTKDREKRVCIPQFEHWFDKYRGEIPGNCTQYGKCVIRNLIEGNGDIYPCEFYVLDEYCMGNIHERDFEGLQEDIHNVASPGGKFFVNASMRDIRCQICKWYPLCRGGCRRECFCETDRAFGVMMRNYYCEAYQKFFDYAIGRMEWLRVYLAKCR